MIDLIALGLTHILMALAAWRLLARADLDVAGEGAQAPKRQAKRRRAKANSPGA